MISSALAFEMGSAPIPSIASSFHLRAYHAPRLVAVSASKLSPSAPAPPLAQGLPAEGARAAGQHPPGHPRAVPRPPRTNRDSRHPERPLIWLGRADPRQPEPLM